MPYYPPASGGGAPTTATYLTQTADATLSNEQAMGSLATGLVKNTTTTGVQTIATEGTDYIGFLPLVCAGRLTLTTAVPVTTSDVTGATTIYFTPYNGSRVSLYTGSAWKLYTFTERSLALGTLTSGKNYDVFLYDNAGTLTLELSTAWTNDTTRADALTTQDGVQVKSGATTRRLVGTFRTTSTTTTEDSLTKRLVSNLENRVTRPLSRIDSTASWNYTTASFQQANASAANQVEVLNTLDLDAVGLSLTAVSSNTTANVVRVVGIGLDSTTAVATGSTIGRTADGGGSIRTEHVALFNGFCGLGYHTLTWLELSAATGTSTWYGDGTTNVKSGLRGAVMA